MTPPTSESEASTWAPCPTKAREVVEIRRNKWNTPMVRYRPWGLQRRGWKRGDSRSCGMLSFATWCDHEATDGEITLILESA